MDGPCWVAVYVIGTQSPEGPDTSGIQLNKTSEQPGQPEADLNACCWFCDDIFVLNPSSAHSAPQKALPYSYGVYGCVLRKCNLLWRVSITSPREQLWGPGETTHKDAVQPTSPAASAVGDLPNPSSVMWGTDFEVWGSGGHCMWLCRKICVLMVSSDFQLDRVWIT